MFSRKFIIRTLAVVGLYIAAVSYIFKNEEKFFFDHETTDATHTYIFSLPFQEINVDINEDIKLHALWFQQEQPKGLVLLFPSGDFQPTTFDAQKNYLYQKGYSILIPDYRGTGKSTSVYQNEKDIYNDAEQWYKMAKSLADSTQLIIYGDGFGVGAAAYIGGNYQADLIVLENPYYSWSEIMLRKYFWMLPHSILTQYEIPVWEFIRKSTNKYLLISASKNKFIKYDNSHRLLEFLKPGDKLITIESAEIDQNTDVYQKSLEKALQEEQNL